MHTRTEQITRRCFDAIFAAIVLIALAPLFALIALLILIEDGRPVLFVQQRVGRGGRTFRMFKFRSMKNGSPGRSITASGDPRVTRTGALLRKLKLDEFAQFFNVLKGDMSLCGPRPEVPRYVDLSDPLWRQVLEDRPGITDPASLVFRDEEQILGAANDPELAYRESILPEKLRISARYLRSRTPWSDLKLIYLTARCALSPGRTDRRSIELAVFPGGV